MTKHFIYPEACWCVCQSGDFEYSAEVNKTIKISLICTQFIHFCSGILQVILVLQQRHTDKEKLELKLKQGIKNMPSLSFGKYDFSVN